MTFLDKFVTAITYIKIFKDRGIGWFSVFNLIMISVLFIKSFNYSGFSILLYGLGFILIVALTLFDFFYILPKEQEYYLLINKEWHRRMGK